MFKKWAAAIIACIFLSGGAWAQPKGRLSIFIAYTGIGPILEEFTRDTGIEVDHLEMSSGEVLTRIRAAKGKAQADAWFGGGLDSYVAAAEEGFLEPYVSPEREPYDAMFYDEGGMWSGISLGCVVLMGNTEALAQKGLSMPQSWRDLTDPAYKDEVLMATPSVSGTFYAMVSGIVQTMGPDEGWELLEAIDANVPWYSKRGAEPANKVSLGEAAVAVAPFDTVQRLQQEGHEVEMAFPKDGVPWYVAPVAIFKGAQHPDEAKALVDWALSEKGQAALARHNTQAPIRPGVELAPAVKAMRESDLMRMDVVKAGQAREEILSVWQEKFGHK